MAYQPDHDKHTTNKPKIWFQKVRVVKISKYSLAKSPCNCSRTEEAKDWMDSIKSRQCHLLTYYEGDKVPIASSVVCVFLSNMNHINTTNTKVAIACHAFIIQILWVPRAATFASVSVLIL